jgi:hypothetical protein
LIGCHLFPLNRCSLARKTIVLPHLRRICQVGHAGSPETGDERPTRKKYLGGASLSGGIDSGEVNLEAYYILLLEEKVGASCKNHSLHKFIF